MDYTLRVSARLHDADLPHSQPSPAGSRPAARQSGYLSRPFVVSSAFGIGWGFAHAGMELLAQRHKVSLGWLLTALWVALLVQALRGRPRALPAAVAVGIVSCYWVAVMHFGSEVPLAMPVWAIHPARYRAGLVAYSLLVYLGVLIGVVNLWVAARALPARLRAIYTLGMPAALLAATLALHAHRAVVIAAALIPLAVMGAATLSTRGRAPSAYVGTT